MFSSKKSKGKVLRSMILQIHTVVRIHLQQKYPAANIFYVP